MRIALAQLNPIVGDIGGNTRAIAAAIEQAKSVRADLVVFGELSIVGYPPRDLLAKSGVVEQCQSALAELATHCDGIAALVGAVQANTDTQGRALQNTAVLLRDGAIEHVHIKSLLPTYDVFDETRYFEPGRQITVLDIAGARVGITVCEDLWDTDSLGRELYSDDPVGKLTDAGAELIVNLAASPFEMGKAARREELFARQAARSGAPIVYVNQVGGNDELVFDGSSGVFHPEHGMIARAKSFAEDLCVVDLDKLPAELSPPAERFAQLSAALKLGIADYVRKCGFSSVVLGLSGGIDSAVVAALAADALGPENVHCLLMPSKYSSDHSISDSVELAENYGIPYEIVPIKPMHDAFSQSLASLLDGGNAEIADENMQARIRGLSVMAHSNAHGHLALATGNKSELAVGYCTLYGDMCGGLAPIGDVLKTDTYTLARQLNAERDGRPGIPEHILTKPPSAELKPGQVDQDNLPEYDVLDDILRRAIEHEQPADAIIAAGHDPALVQRILRMTDRCEFKRQQAARVLKVSCRAFGMGRRVPIAQRYRETTEK